MQILILGVLALFGVGLSGIAYKANQPQPAPITVPLSAVVDTIKAKEESKEVSPAKSEMKPVIQKIVPVESQIYTAPAYYYPTDHAYQNLLDTIENTNKALLRQEKQRQEELEDWADSIQEENENILNCQDAIEDVEKGIRAEIEAAGGFGTNSQIRAMALSRVDC